MRIRLRLKVDVEVEMSYVTALYPNLTQEGILQTEIARAYRYPNDYFIPLITPSSITGEIVSGEEEETTP